MQRVWAAIGEIYISTAFQESGRAYDPDRERERIERQIDQLVWQPPSEFRTKANYSLIEQVVNRNLSGVHAAATGTLRCPDGKHAPVHGLIGIEGQLKAQGDGSRVRLYALDLGPHALALAYDTFAPASTT